MIFLKDQTLITVQQLTFELANELDQAVLKTVYLNYVCYHNWYFPTSFEHSISN